jgi:hypothetical protein
MGFRAAVVSGYSNCGTAVAPAYVGIASWQAGGGIAGGSFISPSPATTVDDPKRVAISGRKTLVLALKCRFSGSKRAKFGVSDYQSVNRVNL